MPGPLARWFLACPASAERVFSVAFGRLGALYVGASTVVLTMTTAVIDPHHVTWFAALPIAAYAPPLLLLAVLGFRWVPVATGDMPAYLLWAAGMATIGATGVGMVVGQATGWRVANPVGPAVIVAISALLIAGTVGLTRRRSGQRRLLVDMVEAVMATAALVTPAAMLWGGSILAAEESWYTVPAALAAIGMVFGSCWTLALVVRLGPDAGLSAKAGLAFTLLGTADAAIQVANGVSGFTLPASPQSAAHAACLGAAVLVPLHAPGTSHVGLDRLPPQAQVRAGYLTTLLLLSGLPLLVAAAVTTADRTPWALPLALGTTTALAALAGVRHLATIGETRDLYSQVEAAAAERHDLLGRLVERTQEDRHRVAGQLLEQTVTAYMAVLSVASTQPGAQPDAGALDAGHGYLRNDLAEQADALRALMQAIKPPVADPSGTRTLAVPVRAYLDSLYGDAPTPRLTVTTAPGLYLDWPTETVVLRIIQEALHNVWKHSHATEVEVSIEAVGAITTATIRDNGIGFTAPAPPGTGMNTMHAFATLMGGTVEADTAPGRGTALAVRLGPPMQQPVAATPHGRRPHLHLVPEPSVDASANGKGTRRP